VDFDWLEGQPAVDETRHLRHVAFTEPMQIALSGRRSLGVVLKPGLRLTETGARSSLPPTA
jgi:hypothetical protein